MTAGRSSAGSARASAVRCSRRSRRRCSPSRGRRWLQAAGRTDAGVHALGQVAHLDLTRDWTVDTVRDALNAHLRPEPVAILAAERVGEEFDARFSAGSAITSTASTTAAPRSRSTAAVSGQ